MIEAKTIIDREEVSNLSKVATVDNSVCLTLGSSIGTKMAGVEHAMIERMKMFNDIGYENYILTLTNVDTMMESENVINMFRFYQGFIDPCDVVSEINHMTDMSHLKRVEVDDKILFINSKGDVVVQLLKGKKDDIYTTYILYDDTEYNISNNNYYVNVDGKNLYYNDDNELIIVHNIMNNTYEFYNGDVFITMNHLEMVEMFINDLINSFGDRMINLFYDRTDLIEDLPVRLKGESYDNLRQYLIIHNNHIASNDTNVRQMNSFYTYLLKNSNCFDCVITSTEEQAFNIWDRFDCKTTNIPVSYVSNETIEKAKSMNNRYENTFLMLTRLAEDKNIKEVIQSFTLALNMTGNNEAMLNIYGFPTSDEYMDDLKNTINRLGMNDNIFIHPYIMDKEVLKNICYMSDYYLLSSTAEGFNIGLLDGLSGGCIGVVSDVKYGGSEQISDGDTGLLSTYGSFEEFTNNICKAIRMGKSEKDILRNKSLEHIKDFYSYDGVKGKWKLLIEGWYN